MSDQLIGRYEPPDDGHAWSDSRELTPVSLYLRYLEERRAWEKRVIKAGGLSSSKGPRLLKELAALHEELSTPGPLGARDASVAKPPPRDARGVTVRKVVWATDDLVRVSTTEADPTFRNDVEIVVERVEGRWRLSQRVIDFGGGRRLRML